MLHLAHDAAEHEEAAEADAERAATSTPLPTNGVHRSDDREFLISWTVATLASALFWALLLSVAAALLRSVIS